MDSQDKLLEHVAEIVAAYVGNNTVAPDDVPGLVAQTHAALTGCANGEANAAEPQEPAVPVAKSITDDYIICLEDGQKFKSLKRHLGTKYGMTPDEYRSKWGLPATYPMVAPSYSKRRSQLAQKNGLGHSRSKS